MAKRPTSRARPRVRSLKPSFTTIDPISLPRAPLSLSDWLARPQGAISKSQAPKPGTGPEGPRQVSRFADAGVPILFISKKDSGLRLYIDYRFLNIFIVKNY